MKYYAGLDGGATKTKCVLADDNLNVIAEATGSASNFLIIGARKVSETIFNLLTDVSKQAGISINDISSIVIGSTGAGRKEEAEKLRTDFVNYAKSQNVSINNFIVESDARIALEGATSGNPGSILIAGTGSIMLGKDSNGVIHRVGGFGRFIGDEGSGYSLGRSGFTATAKEFDGRGPETLFTKLLAKKFGITNTTELIQKIYSENFDIPQAAPLVIQAADEGDKVCQQIIFDQVDELLLHIEAMRKKIPVNPFRVALIGSPLTKDNFYSRTFRKKATERFENLVLHEPDFPPEIGAIIMAKQNI